jgi:ABC-type hemin transport system ATPase subunit
LTLSVRQNSIFGFLGPNGAGKTTTIKLLLGLARLCCRLWLALPTPSCHLTHPLCDR